jgi:hypothetical protein
MATPGVMIRFRDKVSSIDEHNKILAQNGSALWGLWLKAFENKNEVLAQLNKGKVDRIYIADTSSKAKPSIYVCDVKRVVAEANDVDENLIPEYYRARKSEVPDANGNIINAAPQRRYDLRISDNARWALLLSDIHLGDDHAFRYTISKAKTDTGPQRTLAEVLREDLTSIGAIEEIGCVIISGDILTRGAWSAPHKVEDKELSGFDLAKLFLEDLSAAVSVDRRHFFMVPGNHDIVRKVADSSQMQEALLHYSHEQGFRALREEFCDIYKLSPLNYVAQLSFGDKRLLLGMLNSAYLNEETKFAEYGYVGDDADKVFEFLEQEDSEKVSKIVVLHHHVLPIYEKEIVADGRISVTLDAVRLLRRAQEAGVSTIFHGHQHATKRMVFSASSAEMNKKSRNEGRLVTVVAAGSSGAKRDRLPKDETNAYALVDLSQIVPAVRMRRIYSDGRRGEDW